MPCAIKNCKIKSNINPRTGLCPSCDSCFSGISRRMQSQERQSVARDQHLAQRRGDGYSGAPSGGDDSDEDNQQATGSSGGGGTRNLPRVDLAQLVASHSTMERNGTIADTSKVLKDILGVVINMYAKGEDIETVKKATEENSFRISQLEAKVGSAEEVALPLGLAVRHLPLPGEGVTELDNVRMAFREINAAGIEVQRDIVKAVRVGYRAESDPGVINSNLGTVKVEMRNEECRALVMTNKYQLKQHPQLVMKNLVIQNLKSREEMKAENFNYDILKIVTNGNDFYIGGNGHIRKRDHTNPYNGRQHALAPRDHRHQHAVSPQDPNDRHFPAPRDPSIQLRGPPPQLNPYRHVLHQPRNQYHVPPPRYNQYQNPPQPNIHLQQGAHGPQNLRPVPYHQQQQQASLLDIETEFSFDPIPPNNPFIVPAASRAPPNQAASQAPPSPAAQAGRHHGGHGQQDRALDQGNQAGQ